MQQPESVVCGDFNNDSNPDIAFINIDRTETEIRNITVVTRLGAGTGAFSPDMLGAENGWLRAMTSGDFDGDGNLDLGGLRWWSEEVSIQSGMGDGTFSEPHSRIGVAMSSNSLIASDFNRDGHKDLAVACGANNLSVLLNRGNGTFVDEKRYLVWNSPSAVAEGNFNGDGFTDLAVSNSASDDVCVMFGKGDGTFRDQMEFPARYGVGECPIAVTAADFNGDGLDDIATANYGNHPDYNNTISALINKGDGTFYAHFQYVVGAGPCAIVAADMNADGRPDLAVANAFSDDVSILPGRGDGTFAEESSYPTGRRPASIGCADFNKDGADDLAVANRLGGCVSVILGSRSGQPAVLPTATPVPTPGERPCVVIEAPYREYRTASSLSINWLLIPALKPCAADAYFAVRLPGGEIYFYDGKGINGKAAPLAKNVEVNCRLSGSLGPFPVPQNAAAGEYVCYAVLSRPNKSPWRRQNRISDLALCKFEIPHP